MKILMKNNNYSAFTLVEILLALAILGIGLVGILSVFVVGTNSVRRTVEMTEASLLAQMILEDFKRQGHIDPSNLTLPDLSDYDEYKEYKVVSNPESISSPPGLYKIQLTINKNGREIVKFTTYITKYAP